MNVSESYFDAKVRITNSFSHKWEIDNFKYLYQEGHKLPFIRSDNFGPQERGKFPFFLELHPFKSNKGTDYISLFLFFVGQFSFTKDYLKKIRCTFSILNESQEKTHIKSIYKNVRIYKINYFHYF